LSSGYHLQTNGESEHVNQEVKGYLHMYCAESLNSWASKLPIMSHTAKFAHNSCIHSVHKMTPSSLVMGYDPAPYP
ncbi:hypothetical protein BKA82DRAFT_46355, partial [Pisolithus tinctorius]